MNEASFQRFIEFVELDQRIHQLTNELAEGSKKVDFLEHEIARVLKTTEEASTLFSDVRKRVDANELENKVLLESEKEKRLKLAAAASPKEFFSLEHEIEVIQKKRELLDDAGIELISEFEEAQKKYTTLKLDEPAQIEALQFELSELEKRLEHVHKLKQSYEQENKVARLKIPEEFLDRFDSMKQRVENPVVPLLRGSCPACFYAASQSDIMKIQKNELVSCRDCYRLLYITKPKNNE